MGGKWSSLLGGRGKGSSQNSLGSSLVGRPRIHLFLVKGFSGVHFPVNMLWNAQRNPFSWLVHCILQDVCTKMCHQFGWCPCSDPRIYVTNIPSKITLRIWYDESSTRSWFAFEVMKFVDDGVFGLDEDEKSGA
nr:hypothetical protein [Tanacetum cinerariifolium]